MAKHKSKSHHEDVLDDEPEAGWTGDTHAEQHEGEDLPPAEPPPPPPAVRLNMVIGELQHAAAHNGPVPPSALKELQSIAGALAEGKPTMPVIVSVEPHSAPEGTIDLTVTGQNFSPESVICYGDNNQVTTVVDATHLTATVESGAPDIYVVVVHDPAGDSNEIPFEVT